MAADAGTESAVNGISGTSEPMQMAIELPRIPGLRIHVHLTSLPHSLLLFLSTSASEAGGQASSMGSFVYAMPDRYNPTQPMSTALYTLPSSVDFATRMAKILARRLQKPCYVGSSVNLSATPGGGSLDEERDAIHSILDAVTAHVA